MSHSCVRKIRAAKETLRATATSNLKAGVTLAAIQPAVLGHQPECFIAASFPFSIRRLATRARPYHLRRFTSRTLAVMATPCRIRERLDQRSKRAEKIVRRNRAKILRLFVKQDVTEIQELVYLADKNARDPWGNAMFSLFMIKHHFVSFYLYFCFIFICISFRCLFAALSTFHK